MAFQKIETRTADERNKRLKWRDEWGVPSKDKAPSQTSRPNGNQGGNAPRLKSCSLFNGVNAEKDIPLEVIAMRERIKKANRKNNRLRKLVRMGLLKK